MELIAEKLGGNVCDIALLETRFAEYDKGEVRMFIIDEIPNQTLLNIQREIQDRGVFLTDDVVQVGQYISVKFQKRLAPLAIIGLVLGGITATVAGWQIFSATKLGVPVWVWFVGGTALLYLALRKPVKTVAGGYVRKKLDLPTSSKSTAVGPYTGGGYGY